MEIGLAFEDEDLQCNEKNTVGDRHVPYNVKICVTQWFEESLHDQKPKDEEHQLTILKFCGDYHYQQKDFIMAATKYESIIDIISGKGYSALWHDVKESLSRCYIYTKQAEKGLEIAREMVTVALQEDEPKQRQALSLLALGYEKSEKWLECIETLESLCCLQSQFAQTWHKLGDSYNFLKIHEGKSLVDDDDCLVKQLTCYIRAKLLFESVMGTVGDFLKDRNAQIIQQLHEKIQEVPATQARKELATEFIATDIENQAANYTKDSTGGETFFERFCSWNSTLKR